MQLASPLHLLREMRLIADTLQSAGVLLQQYILKHWSGISHVFEDPSTPNEVSSSTPSAVAPGGPSSPLQIKAQIRPIIFSGLSDPQRKIRMASVSYLPTVVLNTF